MLSFGELPLVKNGFCPSTLLINIHRHTPEMVRVSSYMLTRDFHQRSSEHDLNSILDASTCSMSGCTGLNYDSAFPSLEARPLTADQPNMSDQNPPSSEQ